MFKSCNFNIALRYLRAKKLKFGFSFLPLVVILAVAVSVFIVTTVKFVFNGFNDQIGQKISAASANIEIFKYDNKALNNVEKILNTLDKKSYINSIQAILEVESLMQYKDLKVPVKVISYFENDYLAKSDIRINNNIAERIGAYYDDKVTIISPKLGLSLFGLNMRKKNFTIVDITNSDFKENSFDNKVYISNIIARKLFLYNDANKIKIYVDDVFKVIDYKKDIIKTLKENNIENLVVSDWIDNNKILFDSIRIEHTAIMLLISLIILVAAVNIFSVLVMLVNNKKNDIGILLTMGLCKKDIVLLYFYTAIIMGIIGIFFGNVLSILFSVYIPEISMFLEKYFNFYLLNGTRFGLDYMPSKIEFSDLFSISFLTLFIILLSAIYPVFKISKVSPVKVLNYDK